MRALVLAFALAACTGDPATGDAGTAGPGEAPDVEDLRRAPSGLQAPVADGPADLAPPLVGTLRSARPDGRACSLTLADDVGTEAVVLASPDLCAATALVGRRVRLTYEEETVPSEGCAESEECPDDTVLLAVEMEAVE